MNDPAHLIAQLQRHGIDIEEIGKALGRDWVEVGRCRDCRFYHRRYVTHELVNPEFEGWFCGSTSKYIENDGDRVMNGKKSGFCSEFVSAIASEAKCNSSCKHSRPDFSTQNPCFNCEAITNFDRLISKVSHCNHFGANKTEV